MILEPTTRRPFRSNRSATISWQLAKAEDPALRSIPDSNRTVLAGGRAFAFGSDLGGDAQAASVSEAAPRGFIFRFAGEHKEQVSGFQDLTAVLVICVFSLYLALLAQFRHAVKPLIVFAAIPYGAVGAIVSLAIMGQPFGFMAFLGVISLIGVIVSHIIVLFEFIEERREEGEELEMALADAGILRLRPVMITVLATVIALFPLAAHGGPLWEPLCYAQIGGLTIATFVTLGLVPVLYSFVVLDLKLISWKREETSSSEATEAQSAAPETSGVLA